MGMGAGGWGRAERERERERMIGNVLIEQLELHTRWRREKGSHRDYDVSQSIYSTRDRRGERLGWLISGYRYSFTAITN